MVSKKWHLLESPIIHPSGTRESGQQIVHVMQPLRKIQKFSPKRTVNNELNSSILEKVTSFFGWDKTFVLLKRKCPFRCFSFGALHKQRLRKLL